VCLRGAGPQGREERRTRTGRRCAADSGRDVCVGGRRQVAAVLFDRAHGQDTKCLPRLDETSDGRPSQVLDEQWGAGRGHR
jgi:hypothetical protein